MNESKPSKGSSERSEDATRDDVLKRMLATPPHRHATETNPLRSGDSYVVRDGRWLIAHPTRRDKDTGSITADLYRNLDDYRSGRVMERGFTYRP